MTDTERADDVEVELAAIRTIMGALTALDASQRDRVLDYVYRRLGISHRAVAANSALATSVLAPAPAAAHVGTVAPRLTPSVLSDVRSFAATKQPSNDTERVAVVAYYLAEIGTGEDKKGAVTSEDITKYFKQAGFPLPARPRQTLHNAKNAGYLDASAEAGSYRLNPVGHNLVVHGLPASSASAKVKPKKKAAKKTISRQ
jgi:hypothetical protein